MILVTRSQLGWPSAEKLTNANTNLGMVAHFDGNKGLLGAWEADGHKACMSYWKSTRNFHINGRGWKDVGYAYFICPCGFVLEGRGFGKQQAAELPTPGKLQNGNSRYVAVTFGTGIGEMPTQAAIEGFRSLRKYLIKEHKIEKSVYGHRDFTSTDCPGDVIYRLVKNNVLIIEETEEDDEVNLPILHKGIKSLDVLTLRGLIFQRFVSKKFENDSSNLFAWLRNQEFDDELDKNVREYQEWKQLEVDGIVGRETWNALERRPTK